MSFEDPQIDVLLRRHAERARSKAAIEHLDADELNAFAEGSLPVAARSRFVSHLADCDDCRRLVSQLAISAGAVAKATSGAPATADVSWLEKLGVFFRPPALRYAAFAAVVVAAVGVAFLVMRQTQQNRESALVAKNEQPSQARADITKSEETAKAPAEKNAVANNSLASTPPATPQSRLNLEREESKTLANPQATPKLQKETDEPVALAGKQITETEVAESKPTYAPPPPQESPGRVATKSSDQQLRPRIGGASQSSGTLFGQTGGLDRKQSEQPSSKQSKDDNSAVAQNQTPISGRVINEKAKGPRRDADNVAAANRSVNEARPPAPKTEDVRGEKRSTSGEESETRSVGGHKFRRQGSAWIDAKFKSSMSLKSISRGSEEFTALDSGLRSIAQQVGGEVIIVWKGKAYVIR